MGNIPLFNHNGSDFVNTTSDSVADIHFQNGSSVGIAKIEGSPEYRQMMRAQNWSVTGQDPYPNDSLWVEQFTSPTQSFGDMRLQSIFDRFTDWWGHRASDSQARSLTPMLRALKTATESFVGSMVTDAMVVFPARASDSLYDAVSSATSALALNMPVDLRLPAGHLAAVANGVGSENPSVGPCDPTEIVLTIDYSRAALTTMLLVLECSLFEAVRRTHNVSLGSDNWSAGHRELLTSELRQIVRLQGLRKTDLPDHISSLVLLGEHGMDVRLRDVLKQVFQETDNHAGAKALSIGLQNIVDPLFAAAFGAAATSLQILEAKQPGCIIID